MAVDARIASIEFSFEGHATVTYRIEPIEIVQPFLITILVENERNPATAAKRSWDSLTRVFDSLADKNTPD
ncbi:hypothetical protein BZG35_03550 [Brevundimonas sp. LM2]|nr:hypothetical protein BZG35_03550 [Brevundimonas sp. LM2]